MENKHISPSKIVFDACHDYNMIYIDIVNVNNKNVLLFKESEDSDLFGFIKYFDAKKIEISHTEDNLYGIII